MIKIQGYTLKTNKAYITTKKEIQKLIEIEHRMYSAFLKKALIYIKKNNIEEVRNKNFYYQIFNEVVLETRDISKYFGVRLKNIDSLISIVIQHCLEEGIESYLKRVNKFCNYKKNNVEFPYGKLFFNDKNKAVTLLTEDEPYDIYFQYYFWNKKYTDYFYFYGTHNNSDFYSLERKGKTTIHENKIKDIFEFDIKKLKVKE